VPVCDSVFFFNKVYLNGGTALNLTQFYEYVLLLSDVLLFVVVPPRNIFLMNLLPNTVALWCCMYCQLGNVGTVIFV
jgi:hypothetical protein